MDKIKFISIIIIFSVFSFIGGFYYCNYLNKETVTDNNYSSNSDEKLDSSVTVSITDKEDPKDPDLIVDTNYTAKVNGQTVTIPTTSTTTDKQTQVKTEIDLTPVIEDVAEMKYDKDWEFGVGLNTTGQMCLSVQRDYNMNEGVELIVNQDLDEGMLLYKRKF